ncbi:hypothetical protein ST37_05970 [Vibrio sp. qd031]|uniref:hypothetical protein n=1 Tax=Vibrio sp. qd031 TaxID=1603038 RepID=UPI000A0FB989|nr:hypothetical protein [Vibrio sp. qd031]ORT50943.1 hypothetical protein ST37_05970 [Vibrio sp. qd031]
MMIYPQAVAVQCAQFVHRRIQHQRFFSDDQVVELQSELYRSLMDFYGVGSRLNFTKRDLALIDLAVTITPIVLGDAIYPTKNDIRNILFNFYNDMLKQFVRDFGEVE